MQCDLTNPEVLHLSPSFTGTHAGREKGKGAIRQETRVIARASLTINRTVLSLACHQMNESEIHEIPLWCSRRHMCRDCMQLQYLGL